MDKPENQNPPGKSDDQQKEKKSAYRFFCWFFQIAVWLFFVLSIVLTISKMESQIGLYIAGGFFYIVYLIMEFCSSTAKYLRNEKNDQLMYEKMGENYRAHPEIKFHCECYHYETVHYTTKTSKGVRHNTKREKVVTHTETYTLPYYSERDVSGLFYLNCDAAKVEKKNYIKLRLKEEINFADNVSYMDYENAKDAFWKNNRFRDANFDFKETRKVPGMKEHNLVKLSENEPYFVSFKFFVLFTLMTFAEFYKAWINSLCVYQFYKVRKLVSTRYDLNQQVYQNFVPQLHFINQQYNYQPEYYNYLNNEMQITMPTPAELEYAKQYESKIPNYQISDGNGQSQAGVILDNPAYSYYDLYEPPPAYASIAGNVALGQDQINTSGQPPEGFGQPGFQFSIDPSQDIYTNNTRQCSPPQPNFPPQQYSAPPPSQYLLER